MSTDDFESDPLPIMKTPDMSDPSVREAVEKFIAQPHVLKLEDFVDPSAAPSNVEVIAPAIDHIQEVAALFGLTRNAARNALIAARENYRDIAAPMDFQSALRSGRPFRRKSWIKPNPDPGMMDALRSYWWAFPCIIRPDNGQMPSHATWLNIGTGQRMMFSPEDYLATDFEVMP